MSDNKAIKDKMIKKYGAKCFIEELHLRKPEDIEREKRYYGKKQLAIMDQLTYHHIKEKCKGGRATEENGAILRYINHQWFNRLSKEQQAEINKLFQEYKRNFNRLQMRECRVELVDNLELDIKPAVITFEPKELFQEIKPKEKFNRAKEKQKIIRLRQEYEDR